MTATVAVGILPASDLAAAAVLFGCAAFVWAGIFMVRAARPVPNFGT